MNQRIYRERVLPSAPTFALPALLFALIYVVFLPVSEELGALLGVALSSLLVYVLVTKAPVIEVDEEKLRVGRATINRGLIGEVTVVPDEDSFAERGQLLDARAYTVFQASVKTSLKVAILDDDDPAPYWLFSTRKPEVLKTLLS